MNQIAVTAIPISITGLIARAKHRSKGAKFFVKFLPLIFFQELAKVAKVLEFINVFHFETEKGCPEDISLYFEDI